MVGNSSGTAAEAGASFSLNFGGGLIEIAALTALIGSTTAESLVLGNRGSAGLLWGTMSCFGALSVVKACIAAATPGWLRDTFGVRSKATDDALGVALTLDDTSLQSRRNRATGICGIACLVAQERDPLSDKGKSSDSTAHSAVTEISRHDIYAFDQSVSGILELIPSKDTKDSFHTHILVPDFYRNEKARRIKWKDGAGIFASLLKLAEILVLWKNRALVLYLVSLCSWAYYFCVSIILEAAGLSREVSWRAGERELDIIAGDLPTPLKAGGECKLLLGAPHNVRNSRLWQVAWIFGGLISTASVIAAYMALSSQDSKLFAQWTGFQFLWLALRSAFYHFAENTDRIFQHPILLEKKWESLDCSLKARVRGVVQALSLYQMHVHPRELYSYEEDDRVIRGHYTMRHTFRPLAQIDNPLKSFIIHVSAVVGDTMLSSASFITGRKFAPLDQYDTCVVIIKTKDGEIAVPSARVVTGTPPWVLSKDVETGMERTLPPKGTANRGKFDLTWWYWIPCEGDLWLQLHTTNMQILGERRAKIMTGAEVTKHLTSGELHISLSEVGHIEETVMNARLGFDAVQSLLR
ncbi:MAG: hypothetical protein Q9219_001403 [cf. Caloplaca sp. 3 TL-2023]